jgi:hypothetical protein
MELSMSKTNTVSPLRQRMIEDMTARKLNPHTQRSHIYSCERFAAWLKRSPDTATATNGNTGSWTCTERTVVILGPYPSIRWYSRQTGKA